VAAVVGRENEIFARELGAADPRGAEDNKDEAGEGEEDTPELHGALRSAGRGACALRVRME
jgi:hypothetical protein